MSKARTAADRAAQLPAEAQALRDLIAEAHTAQAALRETLREGRAYDAKIGEQIRHETGTALRGYLQQVDSAVRKHTERILAELQQVQDHIADRNARIYGIDNAEKFRESTMNEITSNALPLLIEAITPIIEGWLSRNVHVAKEARRAGARVKMMDVSDKRDGDVLAVTDLPVPFAVRWGNVKATELPADIASLIPGEAAR